ncbi:antitermination protein [Providencia heimbachae]|uniref:antitermination protein n=1 Tax=Providencia heimbachae TaxID=333962 RepID=UPI0014191332|nr:antitermination protein [Providencia heimbachae]NIH21840.1 antitermination protein [Providencia heimbachae]
MNLESAVKYHFAKSTSISDSPRATSPDTLTGTDVMGAIGYCQSKESFGFSAFSGKMEISQNDKKRAIKLLTQYALKHCDRVAALRKLDKNVKLKVTQLLAKYAYADYCRSAASVVECVCCRGKGMIDSVKEVIKHRGVLDSAGNVILAKKKVEPVSELCIKCNGKGVISCACNDCKGRGDVIDRELMESTGDVVRKPCKRCSGRGYERLPASKAFSVIAKYAPDITIATWKKNIKPFYDSLIVECDSGECRADHALKLVTQ